jgi:DNA-binding NarL/FixJ family response regulator
MPGASGEFLLYIGDKNGEGKRMRVLIADKETQVRSALRLLLEHEEGMTVVGEADNSTDVLAAVQQACPDMVLLDWELPPQGGRTVLSALRAVRPGVVVVALSSRPETRYEALAAGADAFVSKTDPAEQLLVALSQG